MPLQEQSFDCFGGGVDVLGWRNWQTRMVEVHMEQSLGVQVPLRVPF